MAKGQLPGLNDRALVMANELDRRAAELGIGVENRAGARVIDAGVNMVGSLNAGLWVARACLADLGTVQMVPGQVGSMANPQVVVNVNHPVAACMASQYAGWELKSENFFAMGSGPFRAAAGKEKLFQEIGFTERSGCAVGVLETSSLPPRELINELAIACHIQQHHLTLICARTASLVGSVQVVARSVETAMHKLHELKFDLKRVVGGFGSAPLPPVAKDDISAIGRTNDAILYGGQVTLMVRGDDDSLAEVIDALPSSASSDYGEPFGELFKHHGYDFYKIDPLLFSPAHVSLCNLDTGRTHHRGEINPAILTRSFFE